MPKGKEHDANALSNHIVDSAKYLIYERAKWVETWITGRALPSIALLTIALSYYHIGSGDFAVPRLWLVSIACTLMLIVAVRALPHLLQRQWQKAFGHYQISLGFLGLLLLLGDVDGEHSHLYWGVLLIGFLAIGFIYPKKWLMPGEFAAIALMSAGVVIGSRPPPIPDWLFVLLMVVPVMFYLQWKYQLFKPVLFLSALLVSVLLYSEISDWKEVILAVIAALALLMGTIYSIGKLSQKSASSFIQSVGIGVISGLLFAVFVVLIGFEPDTALTWWAMLVIFICIAVFLNNRHGNELFPLLLLWSTHWALITLLMSLEEWLPSEFLSMTESFQIVAVSGSLLLQYFAFKLNNHRLLVWGRIYLVLVALSVLIWLDDAASLSRLIFALAVFGFAIWTARTTNLAKGPPWWKGVVNPRHVVAIRQIMRKGGNFIASIPFIGATASAIIKTMQVLIKLKGNGRNMHSGDLLLIVWVAILAVYISLFSDKLVSPRVIEQVVSLSDNIAAGDTTETVQDAIQKAKEMVSTQSSYLIAGLLFGIIALRERQPLYPLMAMVSFLLAPVTIMAGEYFDTSFFWFISMIAATGILSVRKLSKQPPG